MNSELGAFALRQILASSAVVGPILILIGLCYYLFRQDRRSVMLYLCAGVIFTVIGAVCLYEEFKAEEQGEEAQSASTPVPVVVEPATK